MSTLCKGCGAALKLDPSSGKLVCDHCGSSYAPEEIESADRKVLENKKTMDCRIYTCNNCGGEIALSSTEASTFCIFCGNPTIVFNRIARARRPKYIMPFKLTKEQAEAAIRECFNKSFYIPRQIRDFRADTIRGIYIPYFLISGEYRKAQFLETVERRGKHSYTVYKTRAGRCFYERLTVEASSKLSDGSSERLDPYNCKDLVDFDEDYMSGFYADITDLEANKVNQLARLKIEKVYDEAVKKGVRGSIRKELFSASHFRYDCEPEYALLPVWFLTFFYQGVHHTVLVNGQTGKVVAGLPWNKAKVTLLTVLLSIGLSALSAAILYLLFKADDDGDMAKTILGTLVIGCSFLASGITRFKKTAKAIKLTQDNAIFGFVKKRQG